MKHPITSDALRVRVYPVLCEAVERGVAYGLARAYKHTETPTREQIAEAVEHAVLHEICEWFDVEGAE